MLLISTGPPPSAAFPGATAGVSYPQMIPPQNPPPSYVESLNHQVVAGNPGIPQYQPYVSQATAAAATAAQLQSFKVNLWLCLGCFVCYEDLDIV